VRVSRAGNGEQAIATREQGPVVAPGLDFQTWDRQVAHSSVFPALIAEKDTLCPIHRGLIAMSGRPNYKLRVPRALRLWGPRR
jgi:hypothetical protein